MWRRFFMLVVAVGSVLGGAGAVLKSPRVAEAVRHQVIHLAEVHLNLRVEISHLELQLFPPALAVADLEVFKPHTEQAFIAIRHGWVRPQLWPSAHGALVISALDLDGLQVDVPLDEAHDLTARAKTDGPTQLPLDIQLLRLTDARLRVRRGEHWLVAQGVDAAITPSAVGDRQITLRVTEGRAWLPGWVRGEHPFSFSTQLQMELHGSVDHPERLHISQLTQTLPDTQLQAVGDIDFSHGMRLNLTTRLLGELEALHHAFPRLPAMAGQVSLETDWRGPMAQLSAYIHLSCSDLRVQDRLIGDVQIEGAMGEHTAVLESFHVAHADGSQLTGSGRVDFNAPYAVQLSARLHDASLPTILEAAGLSDAWIRMHLNGDVQVVGTLHPLKLEVATDVETRDFAVLSESFHHVSAPTLLAITSGTARGTANVYPHAVELRGVEVSAGGSRVTVDGTLTYDPNVGMNLTTVSQALDLADVGPIAKIPFSGTGALAASIDGPYDSVQVTATVQANALKVLEYELGDGSATLIFNYPTLAIDRLTVHPGGGTVSGAGRLHFDRATVEVEGAFDVDRVDVGAALATLGVNPELAGQFHAPASGRVLLDGPIGLPTGVMHFTAPRLQVDSVLLGAATLEATFGDPEAPLTGSLTVEPEGGMLTCHANFHPGSAVDLQGAVKDLPIALITPLLGHAPITGVLSGDFAMHGPVEEFDGHVALRASHLRAWGVSLEETVLEGTLTHGDMVVRGSILNGDGPIQGTVHVGTHLPYRAQVSFARLDATRLMSLGSDVRLLLWGTLVANGNLSLPQSYQADAALSSVLVTWRGQQLMSRGPSAVHYSDRAFTLAPVVLANTLTSVQIGGTVPLDGTLDLNVQAMGDLGGIAHGIAQVAMARGPFNLRMHVGGTFDHPALLGEGEIARASLRVLQSEQAIDKLQTHLIFNGRNVTLRDGSAQIGGGLVRFSGDAGLGVGADDDGEDQSAEVSLQAILQSVNLRPTPDLDATFSGDLVLQGPLDDLLLKGKLRVDALRYTARLELDRLIPKKNGPLRSGPAPGGHPIRLGVKLQAANNVIISSNVLETELQADLTLTGTSERPGLLGNVTPLWARARFRDNVFKVVRASVDFVDEYRIFTEFQVQAKTEACKIQADVSIQGNSDSYTVVPYGTDEHGTVDPQDVLACLQFGLRLHDFDGNQRHAAGFSDALPGTFDALWTVSGLDNKVKKLLPINVDELRLTSGWSSLSQRTTARILVGKELGQKFALKYSRSLDEYNDQQFSVEYRLNEKAIMQGSWLSVRDVPVGDFGVDLRLHWELR